MNEASTKYTTVKEKIGKIWQSVQKDPEYFSQWENSFIDSLSKQKFEITEKQEKHLNIIWEKHLNR